MWGLSCSRLNWKTWLKVCKDATMPLEMKLTFFIILYYFYAYLLNLNFPNFKLYLNWQSFIMTDSNSYWLLSLPWLLGHFKNPICSLITQEAKVSTVMLLFWPFLFNNLVNLPMAWTTSDEYHCFCANVNEPSLK